MVFKLTSVAGGFVKEVARSPEKTASYEGLDSMTRMDKTIMH